MWNLNHLGFPLFGMSLILIPVPVYSSLLDSYELVCITGLTGLIGAGAVWEQLLKEKVWTTPLAQNFSCTFGTGQNCQAQTTPLQHNINPKYINMKTSLNIKHKYSLLKNWIMNNIYISILCRYFLLSHRT